VISPTADGALYRLVISTLSWFDLVSRTAPPRPDLESLASRLNDLEGSDPSRSCAWRTQPAESPSPELWFGSADLGSFSEHNPALRPSSLDPARVRREIADALRSALALPA
jgi:hypothetical protein